MKRSMLMLLGIAGAWLAIGGAAQAACPNESIRLEQHATWLSDCRAFELVTPGADKNGNALSLTGVFAADGGDRLAYSVLNSLPEGKTLRGGYVAARAADGWKTTYVTGTAAPDPTNFGNYSVEVAGTSSNLDHLFVNTDDQHTGPEEYLAGAWAAEPSGAVSLLAPTLEGGRTYAVASSADGSHAIVMTEGGTSLGPVPGGPIESNASLVYDIADGVPHLVDVDDAGNVLAIEGASMPRNSLTAGNSVSADGSRILFYSLPSGPREPGVGPQLFMRINGQRTVMVSESHHSAPQPPLDLSTTFAGASADDTEVFFTSTVALTDEASGSGPFLYEYSLPLDVGSGSLRLVSTHPVSATDSAGGAWAQVAISDDGSHAYYLSPDEGGSLWLYHASGPEAGQTERVATGLGETDPGVGLGRQDTRISEQENTPMSPVELSPDGDHLVFTSDRQLAGSGHPGAQLYKFDDQSGPGGSLAPLVEGPAAPSTLFNSELAGGGTSVGTFSGYPSDGLFSEEPGYALTLNFFRRYFGSYWNNMTADGSTVFFQTAVPLVPTDVNGKADVYEWHEGTVSLVSAGRGESNSYFAGASRDGSTVFFLTRDDLIPARDGDGQVDVYAARIDGGIPLSAAEVCSGESCQGVGGTAPPAAIPASAAIVGPGNPGGKRKPRPKPRQRKPRCTSKHRRRGKAKKSCHPTRKKQHSTKKAHGRRKGA